MRSRECPCGRGVGTRGLPGAAHLQASTRQRGTRREIESTRSPGCARFLRERANQLSVFHVTRAIASNVKSRDAGLAPGLLAEALGSGRP